MLNEIKIFDKPFHTKFAEDLFEYPFNGPIEFHLVDNKYENEIINVHAIFSYCKNKYNYKNDEIHYFEYVHAVEEIKIHSY